MKNTRKTIIVLICFILASLFLISGYNLKNAKMKEFEALEAKVAAFSDTTKDRVAKAVVTLPDGNVVIGFNNNKSSYEPGLSKGGYSGEAEIKSEFLKINLVQGIYGKRDPRLDAIVPMSVNADSHGGSIYIVLFNDRGDAVLEQSYARLSNMAVIVENIKILPADTNVVGEEYKVVVVYKLEGKRSASDSTIVSLPREVIIPVINGHFDPKSTISNTTPSTVISGEEVSSPSTQKGTLKGHMNIGPLCPVQTIDNPCLPTAEDYKAKKIYLYKSDKSTLVQTFTPDATGNFNLTLSVGDYYLDMEHHPVEGITGVPTTIKIKDGVITTLNIDIDTGIR